MEHVEETSVPVKDKMRNLLIAMQRKDKYGYFHNPVDPAQVGPAEGGAPWSL